MAEEDPEEGAELEPRPPPGSPAKYFLLVLLILGIEAGAGYVVLDRAIPEREEVVVEEEEDEAPQEVADPLFYTGLKQMIVNPVFGRPFGLIQVSVALEVDSDAGLKELELKHDLVWDLILMKLEDASLQSLRDPFRKEIKTTLRRVLNKELRNGEVTAIYFTEFMAQ